MCIEQRMCLITNNKKEQKENKQKKDKNAKLDITRRQEVDGYVSTFLYHIRFSRDILTLKSYQFVVVPMPTKTANLVKFLKQFLKFHFTHFCDAYADRKRMDNLKTCLVHLQTTLASLKSVRWVGYLSQVYSQGSYEDTTPTVLGR